MKKLVVAHRGASKYKPENTLDAFELAVKQGAHMVELDVRRDLAGNFVVQHNPIQVFSAGILDLKRVLECLRGSVKFDKELKEQGYEKEVTGFILSILGKDDFVLSSFNPKSVKIIKESFPMLQAGVIVGPEGWKNIARMGLFLLSPKRYIGLCDFLVLHKSLYYMDSMDKFAWFAKPVYVWPADKSGLLKKLVLDKRVTGIITSVPDVCRNIIAEQIHE